MQVAKWGNSLAVRLPAAVVEALKEGDEIEIHVADAQRLGIARKSGRDELLRRLRALSGRLPADFKFDKDEANVPLTVEIHETGLVLGARYGLSTYDAMIAASALHAGCDTLWSEDVQHGMTLDEGLRIINPFRIAGGPCTRKQWGHSDRLTSISNDRRQPRLGQRLAGLLEEDCVRRRR